MPIRVMVLAALGTVLLFPSTVWAHAVWLSTQVRANTNITAAGPCGGAKQGTAVIAFKPGQATTLTFDQYIAHKGSFTIAFFATNPTVDADANAGYVLLKNFVNPETNETGDQTASVTLPTTPCASCVLQLIQVNTDASVTNPTLYHSCMDIQINSAGVVGATTSPTPTPTSSPTATPTPAASPTPTPVASPTPTPSASNQCPTAAPIYFSQVQSSVLNTSCVSCHTGAMAQDGVDLTTYASVSALVEPGNPTDSALYDQLLPTIADQMPPPPATLTAAQVQLIHDWILQGALNDP